MRRAHLLFRSLPGIPFLRRSAPSCVPGAHSLLALCLLLTLGAAQSPAVAQGTVPTFQHAFGSATYTLAGHDPASGTTTTLPTLLVPVTLTFAAGGDAGHPVVMDAASDTPALLHSPIFERYTFSPGEPTQYGDALLRATVPGSSGWHTLLATPQVRPVAITIPAGYGYILSSKKTGQSMAVADIDYIERALFQQVPHQDGTLVLAVTHNTAFYVDGDATVCCTWGTHGVDNTSGNSFVLASYLHGAPAVVADRDVQPISAQLAQFLNDPLHSPTVYGYDATGTGNRFAARWKRPAGECGGFGVGSAYFLLEPTDLNPKNHFPQAPAFTAGTYHLQNAALLPWYAATPAPAYSFPDVRALREPASPCPARHVAADVAAPTAVAPANPARNGHQLIGYSSGSSPIAPQWDVVLVAFATPAKDAPEGTMQFMVPKDSDEQQFRANIAKLKSEGRKVMISLGGGGEHFTLDSPGSTAAFVQSVAKIVSDYGFQGVDIDYETPSFVLAAGDTDFRHPTTPGILHLIDGLRQLRDHFGPSFMISLVPEGSQVPGGYPVYGGQFGSYLPVAWGLRDVLSFIDVQSYNTPPLEGLDGEIYQAGTVDYHAAMTELLLHGFDVGGDLAHAFPAIPANKVAVGFYTDVAHPQEVHDAMQFLITGKAPAGVTYKLRRPGGYPGMIGAMFWTIDDDRQRGYIFSNSVGPLLHGYPPAP